MSQISELNTFSPKEDIISTPVNQNFEAIKGAHNDTDQSLTDHKTSDDHDTRYYIKSEIDTLIGGLTFTSKLLHIQDQKAAGSYGGTFTSGAWQKRDLNTILTNEITGASLASSVITLPAGTYYCEASAPAGHVDCHKAKLRKTSSTASDLLIGTTETAELGYAGSNKSFVSGRFTLTETSTIELQHRCQTTVATYGFGSRYIQSWDSVVEVYSDIKIWEIV